MVEQLPGPEPSPPERESLLDFLRGIVRPTVTLLGFGIVAMMVLTQVAVPEWFQAMVISMVAFWFGSRSK